MMEHAGWKLPPGENIASTTRAFPASLEAIFCYLLFFFSSSEKKGSVNIHCIFGSCWTRLYWCLSWAVVLCSSFQESGTQNLEIGMKVRKIKSRHLEDCFFLVSKFCSVVLLLRFDILTVTLSNFSGNSERLGILL